MPYLNDAAMVIILVGLLAGSATSNIGRPSGLGLAGDLATGLVGAFAGYWLFPPRHVQPGQGVVWVVLIAAVGAIVLLLAMRLAAASRGWGSSMRRSSHSAEAQR
jgi:uncharacterized membrane protein YeaQ/YmgE (transglycosylase-associated protein family)